MMEGRDEHEANGSKSFAETSATRESNLSLLEDSAIFASDTHTVCSFPQLNALYNTGWTSPRSTLFLDGYSLPFC